MTAATATAVGHAGAWHATLPGARAQADISALVAAGLPMPNGRGDGASVVALAVMVVMVVMVMAANIAGVACGRMADTASCGQAASERW